MTSVNIKAFRGKVPRSSERLLQGNYATEALNCKLTSGRLDPLRGPLLVHTSLASSVASMYRYRFNSLDNWLVWPRLVDTVRSPTAQDALGRVYFSGDGEPRMSTNADAIAGGGPFPAAFYTLGVYVPTIAATLAVVGGSGTSESRAYTYSLVTQYGEEGALAPAVVVSGFQNGSWNLSAMEAVPPNTGTVSAAATVSSGIVEVTLNTARGLAVYEEITFAGVTGMTDLNATFTLAAVDLVTNKVKVALATAQTYTAGGTWTRKAPHNTTGMKRRIYRTVGTNTDYKLVAEFAATTTTYNDTVAATALGSGPTVALDSFTPPKNGHSLVSLANGALAMIAGNELCLSEQYKPHSWPVSYHYAFAGQGVALTAAGNSLIVATDGYPVVATATVPSAVSLAKMEDTYAPCLSKAGVVDTGGGCLSPSHDGLWLLTPSGSRKVTEATYRVDEWKAMKPETFKAAFFDGCYYAMHDPATGQLQPRIWMLDMSAAESAAEVDMSVGALYANPLDGKMYVAQGKQILQWDADDSRRLLSFWQSADFQTAPPVNFTCAQVHARYSDIVPIDTSAVDANTALLASADNIIGATGSTEFGVLPEGSTNLLEAPLATRNRVQFSLLVDGHIIFTQELNDRRGFKLPAGFKSEVHAIQVSSSLPVYSVTIATDMRELSQVSQ